MKRCDANTLCDAKRCVLLRQSWAKQYDKTCHGFFFAKKHSGPLLKIQNPFAFIYMFVYNTDKELVTFAYFRHSYY